MFSQLSYAQSKKGEALKKGEAYHVLIDNTLVFTKDVYGLLDKYKGKTKLILQNEKAGSKNYKLSKYAAKYLADFEYLEITSGIPWRPALCRCWTGYRFITLGCGRARGDASKCVDCCASMRETLRWDQLTTLD